MERTIKIEYLMEYGGEIEMLRGGLFLRQVKKGRVEQLIPFVN